MTSPAFESLSSDPRNTKKGFSPKEGEEAGFMKTGKCFGASFSQSTGLPLMDHCQLDVCGVSRIFFGDSRHNAA
jgi:hypothetical protein